MSSDPPPLSPSFPLPAVHTNLSPFIAPPARTYHTRTLLSTHLSALASQPRVSTASGTSDEFTRFLDLELGRNAGVRRENLSAQRAHAAACKEHAAALAALNAELADSDSEPEPEAARAPADAWMRALVDVHRLKRQLERLTILRAGVSTVADMVVGRPPAAGLAGAYAQHGPEPPEELLAARAAVAADESAPETGREAALVLELEKRIVGAAERARVEGRRVDELRGRGAGDRARGLVRVHDELVAWCHHMMELGEAAGEAAAAVPRREEPAAAGMPGKSVQAVRGEIDEAYTAYLAARTDLLATLAHAERAPGPLLSDTRELAEEAHEVLLQRVDVAALPAAPQVLRVLAGAEQLLPLTRAQKGLLAAQNHHATSVARRRVAFADVVLAGGPAGETDVVAAAKRRGDEAATAVAGAEAQALRHVADSKARFEEARIVLGEIDEICDGAGRRREKAKKTIPVRGGKPEVEAERGIWGSLSGSVGVIGDGI